MFPHDFGYPYIGWIWIIAMALGGSGGAAICVGSEFGTRAGIATEAILFSSLIGLALYLGLP